MIKGGKLRSFGEIAQILDKAGLHDLGSDIPIGGKVTAQQAIMLNRAEEELLFMSDIATADDIKLQEVMENAVKSMENLIEQLEGESFEDLPIRELIGLAE